MNKKELLEGYRALVLDLAAVEAQLQQTGTDGRPSGFRDSHFGCGAPGTNEPAAAMLQLADGLAERAQHLRDELARMNEELIPLLRQITDIPTFTVIQRYYIMGENDVQIGLCMRISRTRVNQLRRTFLKSA